jgi:septal ring factor EnvC (AmiA/AmiB activator)
MSETFWESGVAVETHAEQQNDLSAQEQHAPNAALTVSAVDFSALEDRVVRAVEVLKRERQARMAAEERAKQAEDQLHERVANFEQLEKELHALRSERDQVRQRVDRLLAQLDALEL